MATNTLSVETRDRVGLIRLNRPTVMNAVNKEMLREIAETLARFDADDAVGAVVVTGDEKVFSAGHDVPEMRAVKPSALLRADLDADYWSAIWQARKPVVAAVAGYAHGGGCELALACDFILAADNARFGFPDTTLGVIPAAGGAQRLTRLIGRAKATEMLLTGRNIDATEAERCGLVSRVFPADDIVDEAVRVAARIAERAPLAVLAAKEAVRAVDETMLAEGVRAERLLWRANLGAEDSKEGLDAFMETRTPQFRGK